MILIFILLFCYSSFVDVFHSHFLFDIIPHPSVDYHQAFRPILYFQPSPSKSDSQHFHFQPFRYVRTASATVLSGHFLPAGVFYLTLLPDIFDTTCYYQSVPGSRQLFFEICRASYGSSKHRPGRSACLIHSNPQSFVRLQFVFLHVNIAKVFTCGENFVKKNIDQQPYSSAAMKL